MLLRCEVVREKKINNSIDYANVQSLIQASDWIGIRNFELYDWS